MAVYKGGLELDPAKSKYPLRSPYKVKDVLLHSGHAVDGEYALFEQAVDLLVTTVRAQAPEFKYLSDILLITASQMCGDKDPLHTDGLPRRASGEDTFVTVVFPGPNLHCPKSGASFACQLGKVHANCPFAQSEGETLDDPAAVYVSTNQSLAAAKAPDFAATMFHEYMHVALMRYYRNNSYPWDSDDTTLKAGPGRYQRSEALKAAFNAFVQGPVPSYADHPKVQIALKAIHETWVGYRTSPGGLNGESLPYYVETAFQLACAGEPQRLEATLGKKMHDAFQTYVVPELRQAATLVEAAGLITF